MAAEGGADVRRVSGRNVPTLRRRRPSVPLARTFGGGVILATYVCVENDFARRAPGAFAWCFRMYPVVFARLKRYERYAFVAAASFVEGSVVVNGVARVARLRGVRHVRSASAGVLGVNT